MAPKMQYPPILRVLVLAMSTLLMKAKVSVAAVKSNIKGWDLYGRVPFDDWLFTTERLIDPNLLKKSYVEAVLNEIPAAYANFQYRRVIGEIMRFVKWGPVLVASIYLLTLLFKNTGKVLAERRALWESVRGFDTPISAARKGQRHKGVAVKGGKILFDRDPGLKENRGADGNEDDDEEDDDAEDDEDNFKQRSCSVVPVVWPKECVSDDIKSSLADKLFDKHANKLLACAEKEFEELIQALPYDKITVVCMETTAEPMKSLMCRWLLSASVPNKTISFKKVNDNMLCESLSSSKTEKVLSEPKTWEDLNFRNYAPIYRRVPPPAPRMTYASDIPFASSYPHELDKYLLHGSNEAKALQGEDKGIEYIRDYIERGETAFSQDLSNLEAYIEAVGDSEEHKRSLRRLSPL
eukprot:gene37818-45941_t